MSAENQLKKPAVCPSPYKRAGLTDAQLGEWKKSAEPLEKQWADNVRKAGGDPDAIMKELKQSLAQNKAAY